MCGIGLCIGWVWSVEGAVKLLVVVLNGFLGGLSGWFGLLVGLGGLGTSNVDCGLHQVVVGVDGESLVGRDIVKDRSPCLCSEEVVQLNLFTIGPGMGVDLWERLLHPGLWEAQVVVLAEFEEGCGVVGVIQ